jgi:hypothetical protein
MYKLTLEKQDNPHRGDYTLELEVQNLRGSNLEKQKYDYLIWIFWYRPSEKALARAENYLNKKNVRGLLFYLQSPPRQIRDECDLERRERLWLCQVANPVTAGFTSTIDFFARNIIQALLRGIE